MSERRVPKRGLCDVLFPLTPFFDDEPFGESYGDTEGEERKAVGTRGAEVNPVLKSFEDCDECVVLWETEGRV